MNTLKRVAVASLAVLGAAALGAFGGAEALHAAGANHELGWRIAEYVGAGWAGAAVATTLAKVTVLPYLVKGIKKDVEGLGF